MRSMKITGHIDKGRDGRFHIAYRDHAGTLHAESPPHGYETEGDAIAAVEGLNRARVRFRIEGEA